MHMEASLYLHSEYYSYSAAYPVQLVMRAGCFWNAEEAR